MTLPIIRFSKIWLLLSACLVGLALVSIAAFGIPRGIDFHGGVLMTLDIPARPSAEAITEAFTSSGEDSVVQLADDGTAIIRLPALSEDEHQALLSALRATFGDVVEVEYTAIDPLIGSELSRQAIVAIVVVLLLIALYIAWAFRKVSAPVSSWKYGVVTLVAAFHDVVIPLGVFALLGRLFGYEADTAFVAALLTILGYSINDTIVVFDRTRENLFRHRHVDLTFGDVVNRSVNETLARSMNTTLCVLFPVLAIVVVGGPSTRAFAVTLMVGILAGAYSSIFVASPLLVASERWGKQ